MVNVATLMQEFDQMMVDDPALKSTVYGGIERHIHHLDMQQTASAAKLT